MGGNGTGGKQLTASVAGNKRMSVDSIIMDSIFIHLDFQCDVMDIVIQSALKSDPM